MVQTFRSNLYLGLVCIVFAVVLLALWIPLDVETGLVEKVRGRLRIGDALAPTVAAAFILLGGLLLIFFERRHADQPSVTSQHVKFISRLLAVVFLSLLVMRYAGPLAVSLTNNLYDQSNEYRLLRTTFPWKYIGFVLGGVLLIVGVMSVVERRLSLRAILTGIVAVLLIILIFDVPFDDLLLPPNGDV